MERGDDALKGSKKYLVPASIVEETLDELAQMQNGGFRLPPTEDGRFRFTISMYAFCWEVTISVLDTGDDRCRVTIEADGEWRARDKLIRREFSMLDSMLKYGAGNEIDGCEMAG